jgi:hypothetical protein
MVRLRPDIQSRDFFEMLQRDCLLFRDEAPIARRQEPPKAWLK